jgi:hypothetical protein
MRKPVPILDPEQVAVLIRMTPLTTFGSSGWVVEVVGWVVEVVGWVVEVLGWVVEVVPRWWPAL